MARTPGRNFNSTDTATVEDGIVLNSSTAVTIRAEIAKGSTFNFTFSNPTPKLVWLREYPAIQDNLKRGIAVFARSVYERPADNEYAGEYSAIFGNPVTDAVYVSED